MTSDYPPNWFAMDYEQMQQYIRNNGLYTGNMVDRLCEIIEDNQRQLQEFEAEVEDLNEQITDFRQWVTSLQGEISELNERANNET